MASLNEVSTLFTDINDPGGTLDFTGLSDIVIYEEAGKLYAITASMVPGRLQMLSLNTNADPILEDVVNYASNSGTETVQHLNLFSLNGNDYVIPSGPYENRASSVLLTADNLANPIVFSGTASDFEHFNVSMTIDFNANDYVIASRRTETGFTVFDIESNMQMEIEFTYSDTAAHALMDVSAMSYVQNGNSAFLYFASGIDDGIEAFSLNQSGTLNHISTIRPWQTTGFDAIQDMLTIEVEGKDFLITAAAGTSSLTSFLVHQSGNLFEQDHLIDDLNARFYGVRDIAHVRDGWRDFIIAGGADDGVTVFEFYPNGTLEVVAVIEDDFGTALQNVSAVAGAVVNNAIQILAGSDVEHGLSQFEFTPDVYVNRFIANNIAPPDDSFNVTIGSKFVNGGAIYGHGSGSIVQSRAA